MRIVVSLCVALVLSGSSYLQADSPAKASVPTGSVSPGQARRVDLSEALGKKLEKVKFSGLVVQAFLYVEDVSGARLGVDWEALASVGVRPSSRLSFEARDITVEQLIALVLAEASPKGKPLAWFAENDRVYVTTQANVLGRKPLRSARGASNPSQGDKTSRRESGRGNVALAKVKFDKVPLRDVVAFFRDATDINFHVNWTALQLVGVGKETPVTLDATGLSIAKALDLTTEEVSPPGADKYSRVYWVIDGNVVMIATGQALSSRMRTRIFDVQDLLTVVPNFKGPRVNFDNDRTDSTDSGSTDGTFDLDDDDDDDEEDSISDQRKKARESLMNIFRKSIGEDMWAPVGPGSVQIWRGKLIITQSLLGFKLLEDAIR